MYFCTKGAGTLPREKFVASGLLLGNHRVDIGIKVKRGIFLGFGKLGYQCLNTLIQHGIRVEFVLTHKDNSEYSVDKFCSANNINFTYLDLRKDQVLLERLVSVRSDYLVSANYRYIIPSALLRSSLYPLNLHGSLLPKYRGRTPHVWAIINGEMRTGLTCHVMEESVDTGDIYHQIEIEILDEDTGFTILQKFENLYPICLIQTLNKIENGIKPTPQVDSEATYFGKRVPEMGYIDFTKDCRSLVNFIRAQAKPYPGAYCFLPDGRKLIVHKAIEAQLSNEPAIDAVGAIVKYNEQLVTKVKDGYLLFIDFEIV